MIKLVRVSNRVTKRHFLNPVSKKFITLKYTPSLVETFVNGHNLDDFVKGVIATEVITIGVKIFIVMYNLETKKYTYEDVPGPNTIDVDPSATDVVQTYECYVGEDYSFDCREVLQDRDQEPDG
jgi:hypothetical protein